MLKENDQNQVLFVPKNTFYNFILYIFYITVKSMFVGALNEIVRCVLWFLTEDEPQCSLESFCSLFVFLLAEVPELAAELLLCVGIFCPVFFFFGFCEHYSLVLCEMKKNQGEIDSSASSPSFIVSSAYCLLQ